MNKLTQAVCDVLLAKGASLGKEIIPIFTMMTSDAVKRLAKCGHP